MGPNTMSPYGYGPMAATGRNGGSGEAQRLAGLKDAIAQIEQRLSGAPAYAPVQATDLSGLQQRIDELSARTQPATPYSQNDALAAQIAQRQRMLNSGATAPLATAGMAATASPVSASGPDVGAVTAALDALRADVSALKKEVSKPVAVKTVVAQEEIDRIARAVAALDRTGAPDLSALDNLSGELESLRKALRQEMQSANGTVAETVTDSVRSAFRSDLRQAVGRIAEQGEQSMATRLDALRDELSANMRALDSAAAASTNVMAPRVEQLADQMDTVRLALEGMPRQEAVARLEDQIAALAGQIGAIEIPAPQSLAASGEPTAFDAEAIRSIEGRLDEVARALVAVSNINQRQPAVDLSGIERLEARLTELGRGVHAIAEKSSRAQAQPELEAIATRIDGLTERLASFEKYAERGDLGGANALFAAPEVGQIEAQLARIEAQVAQGVGATGGPDQIGALEEQLSHVVRRLDEQAAIGSTAAQMSNLEAQLGQIARQLAKGPAGAATVDFAPVEARLGSIEEQIAGVGGMSMEAVQQAAQQAVAMMGTESQGGQALHGLTEDLRALQAIAENGNAQSAEQVAAVRLTLDSVMDRLDRIESSVVEGNAQNRAAHEEFRAAVAYGDPATSITAPAAAMAGGLDQRADETAFAADALMEGAGAGPIHRAAVETGFLPQATTAPLDAPVMAPDLAGADAPLPVDAPSLDPTAHLEGAMDASATPVAPVAPEFAGPAADPADIEEMVRQARARLEQQKAQIAEGEAPQVDADVRPDAVSAARRALQHTRDEMDAAIAGDGEEGSKSAIAALVARFQNGSLRKPLVMAVAAVLVATIATWGAGRLLGGGGEPAPRIAQIEQTIENDAATAAPMSVQDADGAARVDPAEAAAIAQAQTAEERATPAIADEAPAPAAVQPAAATAEPTTALPSTAEPVPGYTPPAPADAQASIAAVEPQPAAPVEAAPAPAPAPAPSAPVSVVDVPENVGTPALVSAAREGDPKALFQIGMRYSNGTGVPQDMSASARWFEEAANRGFAPAQYSLGSLHEKGIGVARDLDRAADWYGRAAAQGNARAMHNLAVIHAMGNPPSRQPDMATAAGWFEKAADLGIKDSQFNLGVLYGRDMGLGQDLVKSYKWFSIAARSGDGDAAAKRDEVAGVMDKADLERARAELNAWKVTPLDEAANRVKVPNEWVGGGDKPKTASASADREMVRTVQALLNQRGFQVGAPDGLMGPKTRKAIMEFQRSAGLPVTGRVDATLIQSLSIQT